MYTHLLFLAATVVFNIVSLEFNHTLQEVTSFALNLENTDVHWKNYKSLYNKSYASSAHEQTAKKAWKENLKTIHSHNALGHSYNLRANHLSDMTLRQYLRSVVKLVGDDHSHNHTIPEHLLRHDTKIPDQVDWRDAGFRPSISSQKRCGACYAFSVAHALQAQIFIAKKKWLPLSEQQIVDCSGHWGNYGCGGGSLRGALRYIEIHGAMSYRDYPYTAKKSKCKWNARRVKAVLASWGLIPKGDELMLQRAVALLGPIAVSLNAAPQTFQLYHSGIYDDIKCSSKSVNHAVLIVGYSKSYWILMNWWGTHWGERGYMKLKKGANRCGIANYAAFAIIDDQSRNGANKKSNL